MHKTLIENGILVPMDGKNRTIDHSALLIENDHISAIDSAEKLKKENKIDQYIDAGGKVVMPGLVNGHVHLSWTSLVRGIVEDMDMMDFKANILDPLEEQVLTDEDYQCFTRISCLEMLRFGNTCISEFENFSDGMATAIVESGIRASLGLKMIDGKFGEPQPTPGSSFDMEVKQENLDRAVRFYDKWHDEANGRISCRFSNGLPIFCSPEFLAETKNLANERGIGVNTHVNLVQSEAEAYVQLYRKTGLEFLSDLGYLDEKTNLIHIIFAEDREIDIVKETGAFMIHCPFEMAKRGLCSPLGKMYEAGINMALGSDWIMMDPFEQMRYAAVLAKVNSGNALLKTAYDFLEMFTIKAAEALGLGDKIGSLEIGKQADIVLVDFDQPHIAPLNHHYDPVASLVYNAHGSDVTTVIIDGKTVMEEGVVKTIDEAQNMEYANVRSKAIFDRLNSL